MVEVRDDILNIAQHGDVDLEAFIVPVEVKAKVAVPGPVTGNFEVLLEVVHEVFDMLLALVLNSEIFNAKGKRNRTPNMGPKSQHNPGLPVALFVQSLLNNLLGEEPNLRQSVHALTDLDINVAVLCEFLGQVVFPHDVDRKDAKLKVHVLVA